VRKELIAAGQANERPGVARTERSTAVTAGHQPALEARAFDAQRSHRASVVWGGCAQVARTQQRVHSRPIATEQPRRFGHTHGLLVFAFNACCVVSGSAVDGRVLSEALASADDDSLAWETIEQIQAFAARGRTWRQRLWFDSVGPSVYLAGGTVEPT
jgi:hypothetical protein